MSEARLALAIQKPTGSTNLGDETVALLKAGGLEFRLPSRMDDGPTNLSGIDIWLMRNGDITQAVSLGVAKLGVVGLDKYTEFTNGTTDRPTPIVLKELGYSYCTLKLGVKDTLGYTSPEDLRGATIATSYPRGTERFFGEAGVNVRILKCEGGAETYVKRGIAQACVEISDTGNSMRINGINPVADVMRSGAILIANPNLAQLPELEGATWRVLRTVMGGIYDRDLRMMKLNYPNDREDEIMQALPARESPTTLELREKGWSAAESLVPLSRYNQVKQELLQLGAKDIFRLPIEDPSPNFDDPEVNRMMKKINGESWQLPNPAYSIT